MGKRIISQRRGRGTQTYRSPGHKFIGAVSNRTYDNLEKEGVIAGKVLDMINCPGHSAPLIEVEFEGGERILTIAPFGLNTKNIVYSGKKAEVKLGNTVPLGATQIGTQIHNVEGQAGDGGKFVKTAGSFARVIAKTDKKVTIQFKSKKTKILDSNCRATVGIVAGGGRKDKPILKAGKKVKIMKGKNKLFPKTSGVAMNAVDHPFGSGRGRHMGKPRTVSRTAPPGRKVGSIASKRTGKK
ncbi:50S ribosomal protein L2 [Candidatus Woesearchaeota archaeon]|jgi:large subunit ribosomal protein L2|nr:50S ribosomal protein L2 [Candidatus Woesearchaeota archaeon]MBT7238057.1 50S ribosomal protein L2 [Candidatus Woesearchaeota archaeon]